MMSLDPVLLAVVLGLVAVRFTVASQVPALLIEWQGCPDCTEYGKELVERGLKKGLGSILGMQVRFKEGSHAGITSDPALHPWVACGNDITGTSDPGYSWYQVAACANPGKTIAACIEEVAMPEDKVGPLQACMSGPRAAQLVATMHEEASSYRFFPWASAGSEVMPEPDTHGDDVGSLIAAVCRQAAAAGAPSLPEACRAAETGSSPSSATQQAEGSRGSGCGGPLLSKGRPAQEQRAHTC